MSNDITFELMETMFGTVRLLKEKMSHSHNLSHLSILQMQVLFFLNHHEKTTMSDIANYFRIELPSATSLMNKLSDQKLVKRHEDPDDRRLVRITLTDKGKDLLRQTMTDRRKIMEKMLFYLSETEKGHLLSILKTLRDRLQK